MAVQKDSDSNEKPVTEAQTNVNQQSGEVAEHLRKCQLFSGLTDEQVNKLATIFEIADYKAGGSIFKQGDPGNRIYVIGSGLVNLERSVDMGDRKAAVSVSYLGPCRLLGCWSCLLGEHTTHTESAVCQKPTRVFGAKGSDFKAIFEADLPLTIVILMHLCFMLGEKIHGIYSTMESL